MRELLYVAADNMNMKYLYIIGFTLFLGCQEDPDPDVNFDTLAGRWYITEAYRDGHQTHTLKDGFFEFASDSTFKTNILQDSSNYDFRLNKSTISVNDPGKNNYSVIKLINDTLILTTRIKKFDFKFVSTKNPSDENI